METQNSFVLEINKSHSFLSMSCFRDTELSSTIRHYGNRQVNFCEIDALGQELLLILNKAFRKNLAPDHALLQELKKTGQLLWEHLLIKPAKDTLAKAAGGSLILLLDEELASIPWELLHDRQDFLCLKFSLSRIIRARHTPPTPRFRCATSSLAMLILANPSGDLPSAYREGVEIKNQFAHQKNQMRIDFKSTSIDALYVKKNICDYDIVHFAGHCEYDRQNHKNTGWVLKDGRLSTQDIISLGETGRMPSLIFSNACHSAGMTQGAIDAQCQKKTYSLASAFLFSGVRHYLGAIWKIEDPVSVAFAQGFYQGVIQGHSVAEAVRKARLKVIKTRGLADLNWASYLLYGDPNFVLFKPYARNKAYLSGMVRRIKGKKHLWMRFALGACVAALCSGAYIGLPAKHPSSYLLWHKAQALYRQGKNQEAAASALSIISTEASYLPAYPLLADSYSRLGNKKQALKYYFAYALESERKNDPKNLASAYLGLGWLYHAYGEYNKAYPFYAKALSLSRRHQDALNEAIALRKLAVWNIDKGKYDLALSLLTKSSRINQERQNSPQHRYNLGCDYFDIGLVFINKDDLEAARGFYTKAFGIFDQLGLKNQMSDYYFNMGEICLLEKRYHLALEYYLQGLEIDRKQGNVASLAADFNMLGELYAEMDKPRDAEGAFSRSLALAQQIGAQEELALASYNLGVLYQQSSQGSLARQYLLKAQALYQKINPQEYEKVKKALQDIGPS